MSDTHQNKRPNNNNRNRNRNRNGGQNRNRNRNNQQRRNNGPRKKAPVKLTLWQKILKFFGLYDPKKASGKPKQNDISTKARPQTANSSPKSKRAGNRPAPERTPATTGRIYVGNLSFDATENDLKDLFKGVGNVRSIEIVYHRQTQRSRGYGFIEMSSVEEAKRAVEVLHDQNFLGRKLVVNGAKEKNANDHAQNEETNASSEES